MIIPEKYQNKVNKMLDNLPYNERVRVARICKPENTEMFIEAVKRYMNEREWHGHISFTSEFAAFYKSRPWADDEPDTDFQIAQRLAYREAVARRNFAIESLKKRIANGETDPFWYDQASHVTDPIRFFENSITL